MKNKWYILIIIWQLAGIGITFLLTYPTVNFHAFIYNLMLALSVINSVALILSIIFFLFTGWLNGLLKSKPAVIGVFAGAFALSYYLSKLLVTPVVNKICDVHVPHDVDKGHIYFIGVNFVVYIAIMAAQITMFFYYKLKTDWERKVYEIETLKRLQLETKLIHLQSKVNPHFLFNTLNTTLNLVYKMPEKVEKIILNLSDIYRKILNFPESKPITIEEETELIKRYLEIEKIRLGERLEYTINVDEKSKSFLIPPLIIQTLIENAIIHGISPKKEGGSVTLNIVYLDAKINVEISDTGLGFDTQMGKRGFGLTSVEERLKLYFREKATFKIIANDNTGVNVYIEMPNENN